jgi:hypothetical protein
MRELWWCLDCRRMIELDRHGRCSSCDSDAVDPVERSRLWANQEVVAANFATVDAEYTGVI